MPRFFNLLLTWVVLTSLVSSCKQAPPAPDRNADSKGSKVPAYQHTARLVAFGPRPPGSAALKKSRDYVSRTLHTHGWQVVSQTFTAPTPVGERTFINLLARFGDHDPSLWNKPVQGVIGAHLDSKLMPPPNRFVGADDAASAVGVILELSRTLSTSPEHAAQLELVFFDGEEAFGKNMTLQDGLYGSREYAKRWRQNPVKPTWGLILDMVGHRNLRIRLPSDSPPFLVARLNKAAEAEQASKVFGMAPHPILDDHVPLNQVGIPTLDIIGDFGSSDWWHTERDALPLISPESLALTQRITTRLVRDLLDHPPEKES